MFQRHKRIVIEQLDSRRLLSVSLDSNGWTVVSPSTDTRIVYVSTTTGIDTNDGLSSTTAVQSFTRAKALVRNGFADWMLLKRGDVFGSMGTWNKWGRSKQEPLYIGAYGVGARPQLNTGTTYGLNTVTSTNPNGVENIVIQSLSFFPEAYNHSNGDGTLSALRMTAKGRNILVEDCNATGYKDNIVIAGETSTGIVTDVTIRRCQVLDSHAQVGVVGNGNSQGIYIGAAGQRITIEENVLDHNGWRANTPADRTFQNHNIYSQVGARDIIIRDNISTRAGFYGAKMNSGGTVTGNFFARNSESVYLESAAHVEGNVVTEAVDVEQATGTTPWGVGINTQKAPSATIRHNLVTKVLSTNASGVAGIQLFNQSGVAFSGVVDFNTVYSWRNAMLISTSGNGPGSVVIRNNALQAVFAGTAAAAQRSSAAANTFSFSSNIYSSGSPSTANKVGNNLVNLNTWVSTTGETTAAYQTLAYPDANRDIATYSSLQGGAASFDAFINVARNMDKSSWNTAYTAARVNPWFWQGFDLGNAPSVLTSVYRNDATPQTLDLTMNKDVGSSIQLSDFIVENTTTGGGVSGVAFTYSPASQIARLTFTSSLADGNYRVTLPAGSIVDSSGRPSTAAQVVTFSQLSGDANRDRSVNLTDFTVLAANFGVADRVFSQGDFNYDGSVNLADFTILASQFGRTLPAPSDLPGTARRGLQIAEARQPFTSVFAYKRSLAELFAEKAMQTSNLAG